MSINQECDELIKHPDIKAYEQKFPLKCALGSIFDRLGLIFLKQFIFILKLSSTSTPQKYYRCKW
ncbi:hypothetical protein VCHA37P200_120128 [Vibrio chagasii]|nr:hypothetical protein VCHA34P117_160026 [Vibrio chagasii]CAH6952916.1 hypothetical protein VCHA53O468_130026 [Vibrio chagasii]CAH6962038.1 hypothetical protein VCHA53O474_120026 [Vibrio chagasii]CAH7003307.1 hypothetical protein VCHA40P240_150093 [Vibrio chagasii]CAH7130888.1 hypothetical protein VCHA37P200_120128 [Vibrio chagasii]